MSQEKEEEKKDEQQPIDEEEEKQKKLMEAIKKIDSESVKSKSIFLYELNNDMKSKHLDTYKDQKVKIEIEENKNFLTYLNKIRYLINSKENINSSITEEDEKKYVLTKNEVEEFGPIKNFWSTALINAKFFEFNKKDLEIIKFLCDISYVPLDYPSFKIELRFEANEYMKDNILTKIYYFEENEKDNIDKVEGCEINWVDDEKNPGLKYTKKTVRKGKSKQTITSSKDVDTFFDIFNTKKANSNLSKELIEAQFWRNDFLENMLEYYLNIMQIQYEDGGNGSEQEDDK